MTPGATVHLTRERVTAYRARVHDLAGRVALPDAAVLGTGIADHPVGASAHLALRPRITGGDPEVLDRAVAAGELVVVHAVRGAAHVHRPDDVPLLVAALAPADGRDIAPATGGELWRGLPGRAAGQAVADVAGAMVEVMREHPVLSKGDLSKALEDRVDRALRPWCESCGSHHVQDLLFRVATLTAGLCLERTRPSQPLRYRAVAGLRRQLPSAEEARRTLLRRFLRLCGPARPADLAGWLGLTPAAARRWWALSTRPLIPVEVDGHQAWVHPDDVEELLGAEPVHGPVLLPGRDPFTEVAARDLVVPDAAQRRTVWRAAAQPGIVLVDGRPAGTWRHRRAGRRLTVTVTPFAGAALRSAALREEAARVAVSLGADAGATTVTVIDGPG